MIIDQRYLGQEELKYVYECGKKRMEYHPELAEKYRKIINDCFFYTNKDVAIEKAIELNKNCHRPYQVWAKVGKNKERYYIEDHYIVSNDYRVIMAAEYIGLEQILMP